MKKEVHFNSPKDAIDIGIGMVHQHFMLIQPFTVTENIILGMEPTKGLSVDKATARKKVLELSECYGMKVDPDAKIEDISVGMRSSVWKSSRFCIVVQRHRFWMSRLLPDTTGDRGTYGDHR